MIPEEIYASSGSSSKTFKYTHPLNHQPVNDGSMRARVAYDLMTFMGRDDCHYFLDPNNENGFSPEGSDDEIDLMIVDGFYKEAEMLLAERLEDTPDNEKMQFQKAFIDHIKREYEKVISREEKTLMRDPHDVTALINVGLAKANLGEEKEALELTDKALQFDPENLIALSNKAYITKLLADDEKHDIALGRAFEVARKRRIEVLQRQEAALLDDFGSEFMRDGFPSAFDAFNQSRGTLH